jgi:hypothetical protein
MLGAVASHDHLGSAIREPVQRPADRDEERAGRVEAEKPDPALTINVDVRPQFQLRNRPESTSRQQAGCARLRHPERHDPDPCRPVELIELHSLRQEWTHCFPVNGPVGEEEIVPPLRKEPTLHLNQMIKPYA